MPQTGRVLIGPFTATGEGTIDCNCQGATVQENIQVALALKRAADLESRLCSLLSGVLKASVAASFVDYLLIHQ